MLSTKTRKFSLLMSDPTPLSVLASYDSDPFKAHNAELHEYGVSDVTSDESTDRSLSSPAEPNFPFSGGGDESATTKPSRQQQQQYYQYHRYQQLEPTATAHVPITLPWEVQDDINISILKLYEKSLPTPEAYDRRRKFVRKIETLLESEWPGRDIRVHVFGSTENGLGTRTSDVDICLTTTWSHLEYLPTLASALKRRGMQRVYMVPHAKVPIVKMWDPQLQLACDMNVNNTLALQNTKMIKTYCAIDPRVRPLAMVIKYWAKQRGLNNAADGGTLSTYTWTCMVINFLQMREPPILPVLHQIDHVKSPDNLVIAGHDTSFYTDVQSLRHFGQRNRETIAGLLFAFYRRYAFEFDYETQVISVRHGRYLSKFEKGWHDGCYDRLFLCIEEPFNVARNLGNSADLASVLGLQREFRRAVHILIEAQSLEALCAPYINRLYPIIPTYQDHQDHLSNSSLPDHTRLLENASPAPRRNSNLVPSSTKQQHQYQHQQYVYDDVDDSGGGGYQSRRHSCAVTQYPYNGNHPSPSPPTRKKPKPRQHQYYQKPQKDQYQQQRHSYAVAQPPSHHGNGIYLQQLQPPKASRELYPSAQPQLQHHHHHQNQQYQHQQRQHYYTVPHSPSHRGNGIYSQQPHPPQASRKLHPPPQAQLQQHQNQHQHQHRQHSYTVSQSSSYRVNGIYSQQSQPQHAYRELYHPPQPQPPPNSSPSNIKHYKHHNHNHNQQQQQPTRR